jgi:hypothetical protein
MQKAADAGAIAGASALIYKGKWSAAAVADVTANGFTTDLTKQISVLVDHPWDGPFKGNPNYVEVVVSQTEPTFFMRVGGFTSVPVSARAVASALGSASGCIYVMDPADPDTYTATGTVEVSSSCGIFVNSKDSKAFKDNGGACTNATAITIAGGVDVDACSIPTSPTTNVARISDPLSWLQEPTVGGCDFNNTNINKSTTLDPGTYCGGIQVSGSGTVVTFNQGLYILNGGGLKMSGGGSLNGTGVMFYNTGTGNGANKYGTIDIEGVTNTKLTASTTDTNGTLAGILFFDDRNAYTYLNNPVNIITGGSGNDFTGALYFPSTSLHYSGGTIQTAYTVVVAYQFTVSGHSWFNDDYSSLPGGSSPIHTAFLSE